jgi:hypothetical protein
MLPIASNGPTQTAVNEVLETGIKLNGITKLLNTSTY